MPCQRKGTVSGELLGARGGLFDVDDLVVIGPSPKELGHLLSVNSSTGRPIFEVKIDYRKIVLCFIGAEKCMRLSGLIKTDHDSTVVVLLQPFIQVFYSGS